MPTRYKSLADTILTAMQTHNALQEQRRRREIEDEARQQSRELFGLQLEGQRLANEARGIQNLGLLSNLPQPEAPPRMYTEEEFFGRDLPEINTEPGRQMTEDDWRRLWEFRDQNAGLVTPTPSYRTLGQALELAGVPREEIHEDLYSEFWRYEDPNELAAAVTDYANLMGISLPGMPQATEPSGPATYDIQTPYGVLPLTIDQMIDAGMFRSAPASEPTYTAAEFFNVVPEGLNINPAVRLTADQWRSIDFSQPEPTARLQLKTGEWIDVPLSKIPPSQFGAPETPEPETMWTASLLRAHPIEAVRGLATLAEESESGAIPDAYVQAFVNGAMTAADIRAQLALASQRDADAKETERGLEDVVTVNVNGVPITMNRDEAIRGGWLTKPESKKPPFAVTMGGYVFETFDDARKAYELEVETARPVLEANGLIVPPFEVWLLATQGGFGTGIYVTGGKGLPSEIIPLATLYTRVVDEVFAKEGRTLRIPGADELPSGFTQEEWQAYLADMRTLGDLPDTFKIVVTPSAWKQWRSIPEDQRPPFDQYAIGYTLEVQSALGPEDTRLVTFGQLLEMAGVPSTMAPMGDDSFTVPIGNAADFTLALERVRRMFSEAAGDELDATDVLNLAARMYESNYHPLDPNRPTIEEFLLGEFSNATELAKMIASGEPISDELYDAIFGDLIDESESRVEENQPRASWSLSNLLPWPNLFRWWTDRRGSQKGAPTDSIPQTPDLAPTQGQTVGSDRFALYGNVEAAVEDAISVFDNLDQAIIGISGLTKEEQDLVEAYYGVPFDQILMAVIQRGQQ